jgi:hypothetical protein
MSRQGPDGRWYSDDGQWVWDGQAWQPAPPLFASYTMAPGALIADVGSGFSIPFRDPEWPAKVVVQALILLIPIFGQIAAYGWMLEYMDNLAQGRPLLPSAGFRLGRGVQLWVPLLVWGLVISVPSIVIFLIAAVLFAQGSTANTVASPILLVVAYLVPLVLSLVFLFVYPAMIALVWREGMAGGFNMARILQVSFAYPAPALTAAVLILAATFIAGLGSILCFIGLYFTAILGMAFMAGFSAWFASRVGILQTQV